MSWRAHAAIWARVVSIAGLPAVACLGLLAPAATSARAAKVITVRDTGYLHLTGESGDTIVESGNASGTLPGTARVRLTLGVSTVRAGFTIYLHGGWITGSGTAVLNAGRGEYSSFAGSLVVSHGGGSYANAYGTGRLSGTIRRGDDAATVQVAGQLHT